MVRFFSSGCGNALPRGGDPPADQRGSHAHDPSKSARRPADLIAAAVTRIIAEYVGREPEGFHALVELAETAGIPVYDVDSRLNFPTRHPLNMSHSKDVFRDADLVLCLDTRDWERPTTELVSTTRQLTSIVPASATWIDIGFGDLELSSWALDYQRLRHARLQILADTTIAIPAITRLLEVRIAKDAKLRARIKARTADTAAKSRALREKWAREAKVDWDASPITLPRLASEVWHAIRKEDWVSRLARSNTGAQALGLRQPYRHPGAVARHGNPVRHSFAWPSRTAMRSGSSSICSPMATSCSTRARCGSQPSIEFRCSW